MSFVALMPAFKVKSGKFKISTVQMRKSAKWITQISMTHAEFTAAFGDCKKFSILIGQGQSDNGKLKIVKDPNGPFKPTLMKHCVIFRLPPTEWTMQAENAVEEPVRRQNQEGMTIDLPMWVYDATTQQNIIVARKQARGALK